MSRRLLVSVFEREEDILAATIAAAPPRLPSRTSTPYQVHGLEERSDGARANPALPWICFALALLGAGAKLWFEYWTTSQSWPIDVGGKPWNSLPAFVPVTFEVMVLFAGVGTVVAFLYMTGLQPWRRAVRPAARVTDDQFALVLVESGAPFDRADVDGLLSRFHPIRIEEWREEAS